MRAAAATPPILYLIVALLMTGPVWIASNPSVVGELQGLDLSGSIWAHWWAAEALSRGANPFMGTHSFLPTGMEPVLQYNLLDALIHAPFNWLFGPRVGYNLATVAALFGTGWSGYALARAAQVSHRGACLTGMLIQSSSFVALELHCGRISQITLVFFLLAMREIMLCLDGRRSTWREVRLGLLAACTALVYWYFGFAFLLCASILILWSDSGPRRTHIRSITLASIVGLAITLPFVIELLTGWGDLPGVERADTLGLVTANSRSPLWPIFNTEDIYNHQLSGVTLVLVFWAIKHRTAMWKAWTAMALAGWVLAMGPTPSDLMPFGWLQAAIPTFDRMWWPYRFEVIAVIATSVLAGAGLDQWTQGRPKPYLWLIVAIALSTLDAPFRSGLLPIKASPMKPASSELYNELDKPIFTVPVWPNQTESERLLRLQTAHKQPTQNGDGEHLPNHMPLHQRAWLSSSQLVKSLLELRQQGAVEQAIHPDDIQQLIDAGFYFAVVDPIAFTGANAAGHAAAHSQFFEALWGAPIKTSLYGGTWKIEALSETIQVNVSVPNTSDRIRRRGRQ